MKKYVSIILAIVLILCSIQIVTAEEEKLTSGIYTYSILDDGTVMINGVSSKEEKIELPETIEGRTVSALGDHALGYNSDLKSVSIPDTIVTVGVNPFNMCSSLTSIVVSPDHPALAVIDGALFSKQDKRLICYLQSHTNSSYEIPQGIQIVGENAFYGCKSLTSITFPEGLQVLEAYVFIQCQNLKQINIPDSIKIMGIEHGEYLNSFSDGNAMPDTLVVYGSNPFAPCGNLSSVIISPDHPGLAILDNALFSKADKQLLWYSRTLTNSSYTVPFGTEKICGYAFYSNPGLRSVVIPDGVTSIGNAAFYQCESLTSVSLPSSMTEIGEAVFRQCPNLKTIEIPDGVPSIKSGAFMWCTSLESVTMTDSVTSIGVGAFNTCTNLSTVTISNNLIEIEEAAFIDCKNLTSLTIPDSVTKIGDRAFKGCTRLTVTVSRDSYAEKYCKENGINIAYPGSNDWLNN